MCLTSKFRIIAPYVDSTLFKLNLPVSSKEHLLRSHSDLSHSFKHYLAAVLISFVSAIGIAVPEASARNISLPHTEEFNSSTSVSDITWATQGGSVIWEANGGWRNGGGIKITAPTGSTQGYSGIGVFGGFGNRNRLNTRFLLNFGSSFQRQVQYDKLIVVLRDNRGIDLGTLRPMIHDNERLTNGQLHRFWRPTRGVGETGTPVTANEFTLNGTNNINQWICFEYEVDLIAGRLNLYIDTADGRHRGLSSSVSLAGEYAEVAGLNNGVGRPPTDFPIIELQILGGYWTYGDGREGGVPGSQRDANAYMKLDELVISDRFIGCPAGFLNNPPPSAPVSATGRRSQ